MAELTLVESMGRAEHLHVWEVEGAETSDRSEVDHGIKLQIADTLKVTRELRLYLIDDKGTASYPML